MWARIMAIYFMAMMLFTALFAIASNAQQQVYAIDVEAGKWYAFISPYNSIGVSAVHKDYGSIPVYRWDLNTSYFIFYAPAGGRVYIFPQSIMNPVLDTRSWFTLTIPLGHTLIPVLYIDYGNILVVQGSPINITLYVSSIIISFNGTHIIAVNQTNPATLTLSSNIAFPIQGFSGTVNRINVLIYVRCNYTIQSLSSISFNYQYRTCNATECRAGNIPWQGSSSGVTTRWANTETTTYSYNSTAITVNMSITPGSYQIAIPLAWPITFIVDASINVSGVMFPFPIPLQKVDNVITASNGNIIVLATPSPAVGDVSVSKASLALLATQLNLSTNSTWILISLPAPSIPTGFINPVLVIDKPILGYYTVINNVYYMFFKINSPWSGTAYIAWNFPRSIASSVSFNPMYSDLMNYITLINGTVTLGTLGSEYYAIINGSISFYYYSRVISISYIGQLVFNKTVVIQVNNQTYIYTTPSALINANSVAFNTTVLDITPPAPITIDSPVYINYTVVSNVTTLILSVEMLSSVYSTSGSWGYRIPVYVTLGGSPIGLPVFRLELPLGQWIRQGLLSIGLEDLLIVDSENKPVYFYVSHWSSADTAVVYVRLNKPPTSSTTTLYVLLYNRALWGTGITYASIMTFDFVKPQLPFPVYGLYNTVTLRPIPQSITFYTTSADYVTYHRNGTLVECHGSFCTTYNVQPILGGQELVVRISNSTFSFFIDGQPAFSIDLASLTYYQNISLKTIQFIEYDTVEFVAHYHSVPYTYSIGYLQGGLYIAPQLNQKETTYNNVRQESPWAMLMNLLPLMIILVILGIVMKFISQPHGGSNQPMVNLP